MGFCKDCTYGDFESDNQPGECRALPKWESVAEDHWCGMFDEKIVVAENFEVGKCYRWTWDQYEHKYIWVFRCKSISDNGAVKGEYYNSKDNSYEENYHITSPESFYEFLAISEAEYESIVSPHRPKQHPVVGGYYWETGGDLVHYLTHEPDDDYSVYVIKGTGKEHYTSFREPRDFERFESTPITKEEWDKRLCAVTETAPNLEPIFPQAGHAYEFKNHAFIYVVYFDNNGMEGDYFTGTKIIPYDENNRGRWDENQILKEIPLSEWFERTREHNPGWQEGGYYRDENHCCVHVVNTGFVKDKVGCEMIFNHSEYVTWAMQDFYDHKFLPITKAQWEMRLKEVTQ